MKSETHATFATGFAIAGAPILHMLGYSDINYWLTIPILAVTGKEFARLVDADHGNWASVPDHTPFYWFFNKGLVMLGSKHRSVQTHSIDICLIFLGMSIAVSMGFERFNWIPHIDAQVISLIGIGGGLGWLSHLVADMLTPNGVWLIAARGKRRSNRIALTPRSSKYVPFFRKISFSTGGTWEDIVRRLMFATDIIIIIFVIIYGIVIV